MGICLELRSVIYTKYIIIIRLLYGNIGKITEFDDGKERELAICQYFKVTKLELNGSKNIYKSDSFVSVLVLEGNLDIGYRNNCLSAIKGDSILIPSDLDIKLSGKAEVLLSTY